MPDMPFDLCRAYLGKFSTAKVVTCKKQEIKLLGSKFVFCFVFM
jgi:hypothetical protein